MSDSKSTTIYNDYLLGETPETLEPEINNEIIIVQNVHH